MKKIMRISTAFLLPAILLIQCNHDPVYQVTVEKDGNDWEGEVQSARLDTALHAVALAFISRDGAGVIREQLNILNIPLATGTASLDSMVFDISYAAPCANLVTYPAPGDLYLSPAPTADNTVDIIKYNAETLELEGNFRFRLVRDTSKPPANAATADAVTFANGHFLVRLE